MKLKFFYIIALPLLVAACDNGSGNNRPAANVVPVITAISNQTITANNPGPAIGFSVSDEQPGNLVFETISDNQQVVTDDGLVIGGNGTNRSITVTPVVDTVGDALISIVVTDVQGASASESFLLTVDAERQSMQTFTRDSFVEEADGEPALINAVEFDQDADNDDLADLLAL